jgi:hypothetical protein
MAIQVFLICEISHFLFYYLADRKCCSWIMSWCQENIQADSNSTAITLNSAMYHLLRNPNSMENLLEAIDNANIQLPVPWDIAHMVPYLDACIKQALRMTPAVPISLEQLAPAEVIELCGKHLPRGIVLRVSAWIVHSDQDVYGQTRPLGGQADGSKQVKIREKRWNGLYSRSVDQFISIGFTWPEQY